jgi:hypothetical protein
MWAMSVQIAASNPRVTTSREARFAPLPLKTR